MIQKKIGSISKKMIGIILIIIAIINYFYNISIKKYQMKIDNKKVISYIENTKIDKENKKVTLNSNETYIAILEIPTIGLKRGLLPINDKENNIKHNIKTIEGSKMPNIVGSNLILAAHSGSSDVAYFNRLDELNEETNIYLYYNGYKYIYKNNTSYQVTKNNTVDIKRNPELTTMTLITCDKVDNSKQNIYINYLIDKERY